MFCLLGTLFPKIYTGLTVSCHSGLNLDATSHSLSQHASPAVACFFSFKAYNCLIISFIYLPVFCIPLLTCELHENTNLFYLVYPWALCSAYWSRLQTRIRFTSLDAVTDTHRCDFTPVASFCVAQFSCMKWRPCSCLLITVIAWKGYDTCEIFMTSLALSSFCVFLLT